jgi:hypothetical protein
MIITSVLVVLSLLSLLFLIRLAKGHGFGASAIQNAKANIRPVDIRAFRNLVDPSQEEYLRSHLPPEDFKVVHRERLRAAAQYIACAAHNAAILVKMGEAARRSSDPAVVEAGDKLVDSAVRLRLFAFQARGKLYLGILLPGRRLSPLGLAENYERMTVQGFHLGRLQSAGRGTTSLAS